jgi:DNA-binding transcriptional MerR regulator
MEALGIGQLAKRAGVRIDTVRYYERNGLLAPRARLASGYRRYGELELARLRFIRRAQASRRASLRLSVCTTDFRSSLRRARDTVGQPNVLS